MQKNSLYGKLSLTILALSLFASCEKPDNGDAFTVEPQPAHIMFVNVLSEDFQKPVNFLIDQVNYTPISVPFGAASEKYHQIFARTHDFGAKAGNDFILQENIKIEPNKRYTLYLAGTRALPKFFLLEDIIDVVEEEAGCSFVNMAPRINIAKLENHYPASPYYGWADTDSIIVNQLFGEAMGRPPYGFLRYFKQEHAQELSDLLVRASNPKGEIAFTTNSFVRMPLVTGEFGSIVLFADSTQPSGYNLFSYSKTERL